MAITIAEYKAMIVLEVGDDAFNTIATQIDAIWSISSVGALSWHYQYLKSKLRAIDILIGKVRNNVNFSSSGDLSVSLNQKFTNLQMMRANVVTELSILSQEASESNNQYVVGELLQTSPIMPTDPHSVPGDASGRRYRGDPYER